MATRKEILEEAAILRDKVRKYLLVRPDAKAREIAEKFEVSSETIYKILKAIKVSGQNEDGEPERRRLPEVELAEIKIAVIAMLDVFDKPMGVDRTRELSLAAASLRRLMSDGGMIKFLSDEEQEYLRGVLKLQVTKSEPAQRSDLVPVVLERDDSATEIAEYKRACRIAHDQERLALERAERAEKQLAAMGGGDGPDRAELLEHIALSAIEEKRLRRMLAERSA